MDDNGAILAMEILPSKGCDIKDIPPIEVVYREGLEYYTQQVNKHDNIKYLEDVHGFMIEELARIKDHGDDVIISNDDGETNLPAKTFRKSFTEVRKACGIRLRCLKGTTSKRKAKRDRQKQEEENAFSMEEFPELIKATSSSPQEITPDPEGEFKAPKKVCRPSSPVVTEVPTQNTFEDLEEEIMDAQSPEHGQRKPPPLIIDAPESPSELLKELSALNGEDLTATLVAGKLKVRARDQDAHSLLRSHLLEKGLGFYTYTPKAKKPAKYVLKRVPANISPEAIAEELEELGFKPEKVSLLYKPTANKFPPPFVIAMDPAGEHSTITEIKKIMYYRVQIEKLRRRKGPTICYRCLARGHTSHQCYRKDVCPRCGLMHKLSECSRTREEVPTCIRCKADGHSGRDLSCPKLKTAAMTTRKEKEASATKESYPRPAALRSTSRSKQSFADVAAGRQATQEEDVIKEQVRTDGTFHMEAVPSFQKAYATFKALPAGPARLEALLDAYASLFLVLV